MHLPPGTATLTCGSFCRVLAKLSTSDEAFDRLMKLILSMFFAIAEEEKKSKKRIEEDR